MFTPEQAQVVGMAKKEKNEVVFSLRNCPIYLQNAIRTLRHFNETNFQYVKDIQIEAAHKGFTKLRDLKHIKKFIEIMQQVEYGDNPDIHITQDQRAKEDFYDFSDVKVRGTLTFKISPETRGGLSLLSHDLNIVQADIDKMAFVIGYQSMLSEIDSSMMNALNKQLLRTLTDECERIEKFMELRTLHKIIDFCPIEADYETKVISWRM